MRNKLLDNGVDLEKVTMSSDGNGSAPKFDDQGKLVGFGTAEVSTLHKVLRRLVNSSVLSLSDALRLITRNPANRLGIADRRGHICEGADADLVILDEDLRIDQVFAKGQLMVDKGNAVVKGTYE